jgi:hypothetical protein
MEKFMECYVHQRSLEAGQADLVAAGHQCSWQRETTSFFVPLCMVTQELTSVYPPLTFLTGLVRYFWGNQLVPVLNCKSYFGKPTNQILIVTKQLGL